MTRRLTAILLAAVLGTLVFVGGATILLANIRARRTTAADLRVRAEQLSERVADFVGDTSVSPAQTATRLRLVRNLRSVLDLEDMAIYTVGRTGTITSEGAIPGLPEGAVATAIDRRATLTGHTGNVVYAVASTRSPRGITIAVGITRKANAGLAASVGMFLAAAVITLGIAAVAAGVLGRRLSRPIVDAADAAHRLAAGQPHTPLPEGNGPQELDDLARSLNTMAASLDAAKTAEQQFLLSVSHDLRTPLTSIRGYAEAIADGAAEPARAAEVIRSESTRLERLVGDLLDLAKLRADSFHFQPATVDATVTSAGVVRAAAVEAQRRGVAVSPPSSPPVLVVADADRLAQIVANLVGNAVQFAATTVRVEVAAGGRHGVISVDDDGPGISDTDLPHVFDRLYTSRSQPTRRESSSGIGLAIVKELAEAMNGQVLAGRSSLGGARFGVYLPLAEIPPR